MTSQDSTPPSGPPVSAAPGAQGAVAYQNAYVHQTASANVRTARSIAFTVVGLIGAALAGLLALLIIGASTGPVGLVIGIFVALLPAPLYLALALRVDRYEPEPLRMLVGAFLWGPRPRS